MNPTETRLSEAARNRIARPRFRGALDTNDAFERGLLLNTIKIDTITLNALFDPESRVLYDARFFTYGAPINVAMLDSFLELARGKTVEEIAHIEPTEVEQSLRDDPEIPSTDEGGRCFFPVVSQIGAELFDNFDRALALFEAHIRHAQRRVLLPALTQCALNAVQFAAQTLIVRLRRYYRRQRRFGSDQLLLQRIIFVDPIAQMAQNLSVGPFRAAQ